MLVGVATIYWVLWLCMNDMVFIYTLVRTWSTIVEGPGHVNGYLSMLGQVVREFVLPRMHDGLVNHRHFILCILLLTLPNYCTNRILQDYDHPILR